MSDEPDISVLEDTVQKLPDATESLRSFTDGLSETNSSQGSVESILRFVTSIRTDDTPIAILLDIQVDCCQAAKDLYKLPEYKKQALYCSAISYKQPNEVGWMVRDWAKYIIRSTEGLQRRLRMRNEGQWSDQMEEDFWVAHDRLDTMAWACSRPMNRLLMRPDIERPTREETAVDRILVKWVFELERIPQIYRPLIDYMYKMSGVLMLNYYDDQP